MMLKNVKMPTVAGGGTNSSSLKSALRRGFTIMELVIVIAVIAVLAAVLIPTFANLTERANESADTQTVENLNTILRSEETITGEKPATMAEAIEVAASGGYNVDALTPTSDGNDIVWIKDVNRFALVDGDGAVIHSDDGITSLDDYDVIYKISSDIADLNDTEYGYYFREDTTVSGNITTSVSADFSAVEGVESVTVDESTEGTIDIALNSETADLQVNGSAATVNVYGTLGNINGEDYGMNSLHVYGTVVGKVNVAAGKVVAEAGSSISTVMVTAASYNQGAVSIILEQGSGVAGIGATNENLAGKLNDIVSGDTEKTDIADAVVSSDFAGGIGTEASPYLIANVEQLKEISKISATNLNRKYYKLVNDLDVSDISGVVVCNVFGYSTLDGDGHSIVGLGGDGTAFAKLFDTISYSTIKDLKLSFNCTNAGEAGIICYYTNGTTVFDNVDCYGVLNYTSDGRNQSPYMFFSQSGSNVTFKNCDNFADINATDYNSAFIGYLSGSSAKITLTDCNNYGNISAKDAAVILANSSGFIGTITLSNVNNYGKVYGTEKADLICWGDLSNGTVNGEVVNASTSVNGVSYSGSCSVLGTLNGFDLNIAEDSKITFTPADSDIGVSYYVVTVYMYIDVYSNSGTRLGTTIKSISVTISADDIKSEEVDSGLYRYGFRQLDSGIISDNVTAKYAVSSSEYSFTAEEEALGYKVITIGGTNYYLFTNDFNRDVFGNESFYVITSATPSVTVYAYDGSNVLLGSVKA